MKPVLRSQDIPLASLQKLLMPYTLEIATVAVQDSIPGSYWGGEEAGLIANRLYLRPDTPIHSALHEACHYICMDGQRRAALHTNAAGDYAEENGVCYLQIVLAGYLPEMGRERMWADMDAWGYSFRLGATRLWFERDAEDAQRWLLQQGLLTSGDQPTWRLRA